MGAFANIDIELQELIATVQTVGGEHDLANPDSDGGMDGRAVLYYRLVELGWLSPTEKRLASESYYAADSERLLGFIGSRETGLGVLGA